MLTVWRQKRRGAVGGILLALAGVLLFLGGIIYNEFSGFRYYTRLIESEVAVLPSLPFVIKLDRFTIEYPLPDAFGDADTKAPSPKPRESVLTLLQNDQILEQVTAGPGQPVDAAGVTLLPSDTDTGWAFTLVVRDPGGREKVIPVYPWDPPMIRLGLTRQFVFANRVTAIESNPEGKVTTMRINAVEVFLVEQNGDRQSLGFATESTPVSASGYMVSAWDIRPYTGLHVYRRPGTPFLIAGTVCLMIGLAIFGILIRTRARQKPS